MPASAILPVRSASTPGRSSTSTTTTSRSRVTARCEIASECSAASACGTRMCSSARLPGPMQVAAAMFTPASLIAAATSASAPGVFSTSMTRSTMCRAYRNDFPASPLTARVRLFGEVSATLSLLLFPRLRGGPLDLALRALRGASDELRDHRRRPRGAVRLDVAVVDRAAAELLRQRRGYLRRAVDGEVHAAPRAVALEPVPDMEVLLEVVAQREVEERPLGRGQLHRRRQTALHHGDVARGEVAVEVVHVRAHLEAVVSGQRRRVDARPRNG